MRKSTPKMSSMVTSAIRNLRQVQGSTSKEIMNYVMSRYDSLKPAMQRQMSTALKRGLAYGVLNKSHGCYKLNPMVERELPRGGGLMEKPVRRRATKRHGSARKEGKGQTGRRRKSGGAGRCIATRGRNAYVALEANIPRERSREQLQKDVVCCFENKWKERRDNGTDSTDPSRSTLGSDPEANNDPGNS